MTHAGLCQCCHGKKANRPRGLCWVCYYAPGVRDRHPSTSNYARRGSGTANGPGRLPAEPTHHPPGSEGKIIAMIERAERGEALFHPLDAQLDLR